MATQQQDYQYYPRTPGSLTKRMHQVDPLTGQPVAPAGGTGAVDYGAPSKPGGTYTPPKTEYLPGTQANSGASLLSNVNIEGPSEDGNTPPADPWYPTPDPVPPPVEEPPPPATNVDATDWATQDYSNPATVEAYFRSRGVTPRPTSAAYWASKYNSPEFAGDRAYFFKRLSTAEEFGGGGGGGTPSTGGDAVAPNSPFTDEIRKILLERIANASRPFDPNAPEISIPMEGARLENTRSQEAERRALGERLFAQGNTTSSTGGQMVQQSMERGAAGLAAMRGTLVSKENNARREDLTNLLQMAIASGDADLARKTQIALANLAAAVQREGMGFDWAKYQNNYNDIGDN